MKIPAAKFRDTRSEKVIHMEILNWLHWKYPHALIHHSANERQGGRAGAQAKRMGQRAGFPDIMVLHEGHAWFFEVKKKGGQLSNAQKFCGADIERAQFRWAVVRSTEDVGKCIAEWSKDVPHLCCMGVVE